MVSRNKTTEELPSGWKVRVEVKNGRKTKVYIQQLTGNRFYSMPQVTRYLQGLEDKKNDGGRQQQQISEKTPVKQQNLSPSAEGKTRSAGRNKNVMKDKDGSDELSSGYTKEINTRKRALERKQNALLISESSEHKNDKRRENENDLAKPLKMDISDVRQRNRLAEHPPGWMQETKDKDELQSVVTKEINTRQRALERRNALLLSESLESKNQVQGENDNDLAKTPKMDISDVQQKNGLDELPPGWLKESKTRKSCNKKKVDPYYIEVASGYAFRSRKDVDRYLGTGDINSCAIKPRKWDRPTPHLGNEAEEPVARRPPFLSQEPEHRKETSQISNIVVAEVENPRVKDKGKVKHVPAVATKLTGSPIVDTHLGSGSSSGKRSRESPRLKVDGSKQDIKIGHIDMAVNGIETAGLNNQKLTENCLDMKAKTDLRKSKKGKAPSTPGRSSKRLAGHEPEMQPNFNLTERALRVAIKKSHEIGVDGTSGKAVMDTTANDVTLQQPVMQATTSPNLAWNGAPDQASLEAVNKLETSRSLNLATSAAADKMSSHPVVTEAETTIVHSTSVPAKVPLETGLQNNFKIQSENQNQVTQQTTGSLSERHVEENTMPQDDYWSDPCLEFAFKTLTGAIPLEETLPGCFPQPTATSFGQGSLAFGLQDFDVPPPFFHNYVQQTAPVQNNVPANQLSTNSSTLPPAGNINLPGCSSQPSLEAQSKDYQTKVKS